MPGEFLPRPVIHRISAPARRPMPDRRRHFLTERQIVPPLDPCQTPAFVDDHPWRAFRLLGCRDYARVDFRIRKGDDQPIVLELNPNPDFAPDRALANNLWAGGLSHTEFTVQLARNALARKGAASAARYADRQAG